MSGRECGCPPWVEQCVHFDGAVVVLTSPASVFAEGMRRGLNPKRQPRWAVYGPAFWEAELDSSISTGLVDANGDSANYLFVEDEYAARDEFRRREALLVGREA